MAGGRPPSLSAEQIVALREYIARRGQGEPIAYILGKKEFMSLEFVVDDRVLVPRPETELLVERALKLFGRAGTPDLPLATLLTNEPNPRIADVGTGSGAIAISLAKHLPHATVYATDVSADALAVTRENTVAHGVAAQVMLLQGDYLQALSKPVHLIVCNPPYIPQDALPGLERDVRDYEPTVALSGGGDGLDAYRAIFSDLATYLLPGGSVLLEIGFDQAEAVKSLAARHLPGARVDVYRDLAGFDRVLHISRVKPAKQGRRV